MSLAFPCQAPTGYFHYLALALLVHCCITVSDHIPQQSHLYEANQGLAGLLATLSIGKDIKCHWSSIAGRLLAVFTTPR